MPIDDTPVRLANSRVEAMGTVTFPTDAAAQWDMVRWGKTRAGRLLADVTGAVWVTGGLAQPVAGTNRINIGPCEGWALEEPNREDRYAVHVVSPADAFSIDRSTLFMLTAQRDGGKVVPYEIIVPNPFIQVVKVMQLPEEARLGVPLFAAMVDRSHLEIPPVLHDLRMPPWGVVYVDKFTDVTFGDLNDNNTIYHTERVGRDQSDSDWSILRTHRLWLFVPRGGVFEVGADAFVYSTPPFDPSDAELQQRMTLYINGELINGSTLDNAGLEVVGGTKECAWQAWRAVNYAHFVMRTYLRSTVNAIHDIALAFGISRGSAGGRYDPTFQTPQLWARLISPEPPIALGATTDTA